MINFIQIFDDARQKHLDQEDYPGYPKGRFTKIRHATGFFRTGPPKISFAAQTLRSELVAILPQYVNDLRSAIRKYLELPRETRNYHSFRSYFLIELLLNDPRGGWNEYMRTPLFFGAGSVKNLYHGTEVGPDIIFEEGLRASWYGDDLRKYEKQKNYGYGVSTSRNYHAASRFAAVSLARDRSLGYFSRETPTSCSAYVYLIKYKGLVPGFDIGAVATGSGARFKEVNFPQDIKPCDIFGAWRLEDSAVWQENPYYIDTQQGERPTTPTDEVPGSRELLSNIGNAILLHSSIKNETFYDN